MKSCLLTLASTAVIAPSWAADPEVSYPSGYHEWRHIKSMVIEEGHPLYEAFGGIHHLYANNKAVEGYQAGRFPDGSVIVFDLLQAVHSDHAVTEGERKVLGVMHKDIEKYPDTGGWGFEGFSGGDPSTPVVGNNAASACFACHLQQQSQDYVFSRLRD